MDGQDLLLVLCLIWLLHGVLRLGNSRLVLGLVGLLHSVRLRHNIIIDKKKKQNKAITNNKKQTQVSDVDYPAFYERILLFQAFQVTSRHIVDINLSVVIGIKMP